MTNQTNPISRRQPRAVLAVWCCVAIGLIGADDLAMGQQQGGPPPAMVRVGAVEQRTLQARSDVVGQLREVRRVVVAAERPGRIVEIPVEEGDVLIGKQTVLAQIDDVWARLDQTAAQAQLKQTQATVAVAQAQLDQATRDRKYLDGLLKAGSAKPKEVNDAHTTQQAQQARLERAQADVLAAQADLDRIEQYLNRLTVRAPFDSIVVRKIVEVGQWVDQGDQVVEVISRGKIDAAIDVPEHLINHIKPGDEVELLIEPLSLDVVGRVAAINPLGSAAARTFPVKIRLNDLDGRLKPGMSVLARVPMDQRVEVLTVPRDAVHRSDTGTVVWGDVDGVAVPIKVKVLFGHGDRYAVRVIRGGEGPSLTDAMRVVVEGAERLFPGRPLAIVASDPG